MDVCLERITFLGDNSSNSAQFKAKYVSYKNFISDDTVTVFMQSTVNYMSPIVAASVIRITQKLVTQHFILLVSCLLLIFWQSANIISNSVANPFPVLLCFHFIKSGSGRSRQIMFPTLILTFMPCFLLCPHYGSVKWAHFISSKYSV